MNGTGWIKWKKNSGPDIWEYKSGINVCNPTIAILKNNYKVVATIIGPKDLSDKIVVNHIKTVYSNENKLSLFRIVPSSNKNDLINNRYSHRDFIGQQLI